MINSSRQNRNYLSRSIWKCREKSTQCMWRRNIWVGSTGVGVGGWCECVRVDRMVGGFTWAVLTTIDRRGTFAESWSRLNTNGTRWPIDPIAPTTIDWKTSNTLGWWRYMNFPLLDTITQHTLPLIVFTTEVRRLSLEEPHSMLTSLYSGYSDHLSSVERSWPLHNLESCKPSSHFILYILYQSLTCVVFFPILRIRLYNIIKM